MHICEDRHCTVGCSPIELHKILPTMPCEDWFPQYTVWLVIFGGRNFRDFLERAPKFNFRGF